MSIIDKIKLNGTTYDVGKIPDTTLTQSGQAADAKVTGDKISLLKSDLDDTDNELLSYEYTPSSIAWEQGGIYLSSGTNLNSRRLGINT